MLSNGAPGYAAIHSRVRVMYAALLTPADEIRLREAADLPALVGLLKDTAYGPYLSTLDDKDITPRRVVFQIKQRISDLYLSIIHSVPTHARPLMIQLFRHFELDNLKAVLRGIVSASSWEQVRDILFPLGSLSTLPAENMLAAGTIEAALALMPRGAYSETISHALQRYNEEQSLFPLEVALDLDYWRRLWLDANRLTSEDRTQALRILGPQLDMNNLMWALRYKVYHHLSEEEIINYTLPSGYRVRDENIRAIAAGANIAGIVEGIYPGLDNIEGLLEQPESGLPKLELLLQRRLKQQFSTVFTGYPFHIGLPLAFVMLLELELQDLKVLIEAKSAQMASAEFAPYLLLNTNPGNLSA